MMKEIVKCWISQVIEALAQVAKPCRTELTASTELRAKLVNYIFMLAFVNNTKAVLALVQLS